MRADGVRTQRRSGSEPLNEAADALAAAAVGLDPALQPKVGLDLDREALQFLHKGSWVEWDARVGGWLARRLHPQNLPLLQPGCSALSRGVGRVLSEVHISAAEKQVLHSIAGLLGHFRATRCSMNGAYFRPQLCGHPAEAQSHTQCLCPALKEARIQ